MLAIWRANFEARFRLALHRTVFGLLAGVLMLIGCVFLTVSAWLLIAASFGLIVASLVMAGMFFGLGALMLMLGRRPAVAPPVAAPAPVATTKAGRRAGLLDAFIFGLEAGRAVRRPRR